MPSPEYEMHQAQLQFWVDVGHVNEIGGLRDVQAQHPFPSSNLAHEWMRENGWYEVGKGLRNGPKFKNDSLPHLTIRVRQVREFRFEKWL